MQWNSEHNYNGRNFLAWKSRMRAFLEAKGLWEIVANDESALFEDDTSEAFAEFRQREGMAKAILLSAVNNEMVVRIGYMDHPHEMLAYLERTYELQKWGAYCLARSDLVGMRYHDGTDMELHLERFNALCDQLSALNRPVDAMERVAQLLFSLPNTWSTFKSMHYVQDKPVPWDLFQLQVITEARKRMDSTHGSENNPSLRNFFSRGKQSLSEPKRCLYCYKLGHVEKICRNKLRDLCSFSNQRAVYVDREPSVLRTWKGDRCRSPPRDIRKRSEPENRIPSPSKSRPRRRSPSPRKRSHSVTRD